MSNLQMEPWLRAEPSPFPVLVTPVAHALQQALEDLTRVTEGLSMEQLWSTPHGVAPVGFQLKHIAGSIDRLLTYAAGGQLREEQLATLNQEHLADAGREELLAAVKQSCEAVYEFLRDVKPSMLEEGRAVGRKQIPTTLIGLLIHIAEHTQRHVGQVLSACRVLRST